MAMRVNMTPDQVRLLGGAEHLAAIRRRIARDGTAIMAAGHVTPAVRSSVYDDEDDLDDNATAPQLVTASLRHLNKFLAAPDAEDGSDHLAYAAALLSTALSRCARSAQASARRRW
jgi:hypothetical protein